jgi:hypothetical protein
MAGHSSEKRWRNNMNPDSGNGVSELIADSCQTVLRGLEEAESIYLELLEVYQYTGGTAQALADQLFYEDWSVRESDPIGNPGVLDTQANAIEVEKAQAAIDAVTALHQLYQAMTNVAVTQADRAASLRRMS